MSNHSSTAVEPNTSKDQDKKINSIQEVLALANISALQKRCLSIFRMYLRQNASI